MPISQEEFLRVLSYVTANYKNLWSPQWPGDSFWTVDCDHHKLASGKFLFFKTGLSNNWKQIKNKTNNLKLLRDRKHLSYIHVSVTLRTIFESTQNLFPNLWGRQLTERFFLIQFVRGTVCIENFELAITVDAPRYVSQQGTTLNLETVCILLSMILSDHILKKWIRCQLWTLHRKVLTKLHMKNMQIYSKVPCITKMNNMSWEQHNTQFWLYERNYPCKRFSWTTDLFNWQKIK